jgi:hypothetical protein
VIKVAPLKTRKMKKLAYIKTSDKMHFISVSESTKREIQKSNVNLFCNLWKHAKLNIEPFIVAVVASMFYN